MLAAEIDGCPLSSFSICTSLHPQPTLTALTVLHASVLSCKGCVGKGIPAEMEPGNLARTLNEPRGVGGEKEGTDEALETLGRGWEF